ncbi:MAG: hypothetical protein AB8B55_15750 [Mariniblastus sp.]
MEFYNFWARSKTIPANGHTVKFAACVGFSNVSQEDALRVANERAAHHAHLINTNQPLDYDYNKLPFCEEVIDRFTKDDELVTVLSRVHYGSIVLNTTSVLFADIDLPPEMLKKSKPSLFSFFKKSQPEPEIPGAAVIENLQEICGADRSLGFRLYRTAAGFRAMATSRLFNVNDPLTTTLLEKMRSDGLYVVLCKRQQCFRARLTPKPYRIGIKPPPASFPYKDDADAAAAKQWQSIYELASNEFSTCAFVTQIGNPNVHEEVESIMQLHDHFACKADLPLA